MERSAAHKNFIFNEKIDSGFIYSLYEEDYTYITEVFTNTIEALDCSIEDFTKAFTSGSTEMLKKEAHKMKPLFGFTGLLSIQDEVGIFENLCMSISEVSTLSPSYHSLLESIYDARAVIISESKRLKEYTGS